MAIEHIQKAFVVEVADVPRIKPPIVQGSRCGGRIFEVSLHHVGTVDRNFSDGSIRQRFTCRGP